MDLSEAEQIGVALGFEGTVSKTGYLVKRAKKSGAARRANWKKRYFVLNGSSLVYYETHKKMDDAKGDLLLTVGCEVSDVDEPKRQFCFEISTNNEALRLSATSEAERDAWKAAIADTVSLLGSTCQSYLSIDVRGVFGTKTTRKFFVLHGSALTYHADHHSTYKKQGEFKLHSGSRVEPRGDCGLEVASGEKTITLVAKSATSATPGSPAARSTLRSSKEETEAWIDALRGAIANSRGLSSDPLLSAAKRIPLETYDVHFATKQKLKLCGNQIFNPTSMLNIVLERAAEWAVVKHVRAPAAGGSPSAAVTEGSALVAVDGDSTMIAPYQDTIKRLTGWQPPLTLTFARAPVLSGWLHKQARGRSARTGGASGAKNNWKERYFVLKESKLSYYTSKDDEESLKDRIHLMGSVVSLVPNQESGRHFTFRVVSGCAVLVMQATTVQDMLLWATTLYHGIAVANGGGYLLEAERLRAAAAERCGSATSSRPRGSRPRPRPRPRRPRGAPRPRRAGASGRAEASGAPGKREARRARRRGRAPRGKAEADAARAPRPSARAEAAPRCRAGRRARPR
ncbi:hypothetical protein JL721_8076 [Aureococcus anophagefferens]|nr:hypothetical protein JL721_8076 [Aureococcus anophagefferens]